MSVEYRLLGPLEVLVDGRQVTLAGPRQRAVLTCLLARPNTVVPATRLIDELWGEEPPATAANVLQSYVSQLRKALGKEAIETRGGGYSARVGSTALDLLRFERAAHQGSLALDDGRPDDAAAALREALALWRGPPLADLADEPAIGPIAARLEELHLLALERRIEADLACGRHIEVVAEAGELAGAHPLRERPRWLHMLALYRSGRQAEALDSYRAARTLLVQELGIEPGSALQELERAILRHDPSIQAPPDGGPGRPAPREAPARSIVVTTLAAAAPHELIELAAPLAVRPPHELLVLQTVSDASDLTDASIALRALRTELGARGLETRTAAFTSLMPGADLARVATDQDADLLLVAAPDQLLEDGRILALLTQAPCDVGVVFGSPSGPGDVFVPFAGGEHDWAAVELGAWLARSHEGQLWLGGAATGVAGRDASRLLASASLAVQRVLGVAAEPVLVEPEPGAVVAAAAAAAIVCVGLPDRWRHDGLGPTRTALAARAEGPTILVRRGVRPGGLAPQGAETRYTWTIAG
ncbi:MAG TPA: BTAD domain-containing putative transcriptional regulator [Gaiellaceae bacterium]|jgi:DNA-binding SARP family transcriptional activator